MKSIIVLLLCTAVYGRINDSPFFGEASNELTSPISGIMGKSDFVENPGGVDADPSLKRIFGPFPFSPFTIGSAISPLSLLNIASNIGPLGLYRQSQRTSSDWIGVLNTGLQQAAGLKKLLLDAARTSGPIESNISDEPVDRQVSYDDLRKAVSRNSETPQREVSGGRRFWGFVTGIAKHWKTIVKVGERMIKLVEEGIESIKHEESERRSVITPAWTLPVANIIAAVFLKVVTLLHSYKERVISHLLNQTS